MIRILGVIIKTRKENNEDVFNIAHEASLYGYKLGYEKAKEGKPFNLKDVYFAIHQASVEANYNRERGGAK